MRSVRVVLWCWVCGLVAGQDNGVRIGLVSTDLGVPAVPGGQSGNLVSSRPTGCFCLPVNQRCPNTPQGFDVRIVNNPTSSSCPGEKLCCLGNQPPGSQPQPQPVPVRPFPVQPPGPVLPPGPREPVVPQPTLVGQCGVQNPLPYRQSQLAEADFGEYPWMAVILALNNDYVGGGALIDNQWILTAAHKVYNLRANNMKVRLGELDVGQVQDHPTLPHVEVGVSQVIVHPNFDSERLLNDVALLRLVQPINTNQYPHIGTVCLPALNQIFAGENSCWVTGWGKNAFDASGRFQRILKEVDVPMVDHFVCQEKLRRTRLTQSFNLDSNSFVCAGGIEGKDACTGDGGAPLVCRTSKGWTVVGLVAWGIGCAQGGVPGVYVNIPRLMSFINQYVGNFRG